MAEYTDDLALIVRYDGTKEAFEAVKSNYLGKVVFIYGSKTEVANQAGLVQAIWVSDANGGRYLDMANVDTIKEGMTHIAGLATEGTVKALTDGANGINFKGANGISITFNPSNSTDQNGVPYWNVEVSGQGVIDTIKGVSTDSTGSLTLYGVKNYAQAAANTAKNEVIGQDTDTELSDTINGAKKYADKVKTDLEGTTSDTKDSATIAGAKRYADDVAASEASTAKSEAIQASKDYVDPLLANKADLENGKISESQLPDYIFGQMLFGGTITAGGANTMEVSPSAKLLDKVDKPSTTSSLTINKTDASTYEGAYFIVTGNLTSVFGFATATGDWIVSTGVDWRKVDNTDAVASVAGLTGTITASALAQKLAETGDANELALKSEVDKKYTKPDNGIPKSDLAQEIQNSLDNAVTEVGITPADTDYLTFNVGKGGTVRTITYDVKTDNTVDDAIKDTTKKGLATVEDVAAYLKARLSVKVVS